ncbi:hypothetical protein GCM10017767_23010 [Halomonas urumqiensis]|nr:hypothetical protein GCM10017767_23010 [Halomonas urumqiensis]
MISEIVFSRGYHSFWNKTFPFLPRVSRKLNLEKVYYEDYAVLDSSPDRRALLNEFAFRIFEACVRLGVSSPKGIPLELQVEIESKAVEYIKSLSGGRLGSSKITPCELDESFILCRRMFDFYNYNEPGCLPNISPFFMGCGVLNSCYGDVVCGKTLYEIKSGGREFRSIDVKQVLIYGALSNFDEAFDIDTFGFLNPRLGIFSSVSVRDVVEISSGLSVQDAFYEIVNFLDSPESFQ